MIAHAGSLFKLLDPAIFHKQHRVYSTYTAESIYGYSKVCFLEWKKDFPPDLILSQTGRSCGEEHCASAVKSNGIGYTWIFAPVTMPALRRIQRFFRQVATRLAQRKFTAFLIYGSRLTDTLQRVDGEVLNIIMKLAGL